jgi:hypothetical protein
MTRYLTFTKSSLLELFVFAFITSALALVTVMMSKYIALNILPSPIDAAKALRHKSSHYFSSHMSPSASQHNIGPNTFYSNVVRNSLHGIDSQDTSSNKSQNTFYNNQFINSYSVISHHSNKPSLGIS